MYDLDRGRLKIGESPEQVISKFEVWWMTPFGLVSTYQEAKEVMAERAEGVPLQMTITPLPVAIGENGGYEVLLSNRS